MCYPPENLALTEQYRDNKPYQEKYKKSKDPDRYLRMHETQLILYDDAERMLRKMGIDPQSVNPSVIRADYEAMQARKSTLEKTYNAAEKDMRSLQQNMINVEQYIDQRKQHESIKNTLNSDNLSKT